MSTTMTEKSKTEKDQGAAPAAKPAVKAAPATAVAPAKGAAPTATKTDKAAAQAKQDKLKAVDMALAQIEKQFGKGAVMKLDEHQKLEVESIPTGSLSLDLALGVGGIPKGRIVEIYGPESSGKTTLASHMIAEVQKQGGMAAFIDAEHAFDPEYGKHLGINVDELLISQPDTGEQALEIAETLVRSNGIDVIVVDSVAALTPGPRSKATWAIRTWACRPG